MKESIPFKTFEIEGLDQPLEIYEWLTDEEESDSYAILLGEQTVAADSSEEGVQNLVVTVDAKKMRLLKEFKIKATCRNLSWEKFNALAPDIRKLVLAQVDAVLKKK